MSKVVMSCKQCKTETLFLLQTTSDVWLIELHASSNAAVDNISTDVVHFAIAELF